MPERNYIIIGLLIGMSIGVWIGVMLSWWIAAHP